MDNLLPIIIVIVLIMALYHTGKAEFSKESSGPCKLHKWTFLKQPDSDDEYIVCSKCGKTPSEILND